MGKYYYISSSEKSVGTFCIYVSKQHFYKVCNAFLSKLLSCEGLKITLLVYDAAPRVT